MVSHTIKLVLNCAKDSLVVERGVSDNTQDNFAIVFDELGFNKEDAGSFRSDKEP